MHIEPCEFAALNPRSRFFSNKGAVAGVFLIVGLLVTSVAIWIVFAVHRRRKRRHLEHEAALAAPVGHRSPLEDEDDDIGKGMAQTNNTLPVTAHPPSAYFDEFGGNNPNDGAYDPYVGYAHPQPAGIGAVASGGYVQARSSSPPPASPDPSTLSYGHGRQPSGSNSAENGQHSRNYSFSSYEPLLSAAGLGNKTPPSTPGLNATKAPTPPPRNPNRPSSAGRTSTERKADDRLDPAMASRLQRADTTASGIRDDQDYSRPVLGVSRFGMHTVVYDSDTCVAGAEPHQPRECKRILCERKVILSDLAISFLTSRLHA